MSNTIIFGKPHSSFFICGETACNAIPRRRLTQSYWVSEPVSTDGRTLKMEETRDFDRDLSVKNLKREELLREYYHVDGKISHFEEIRLKVKSWSVTSGGVAIGFGFAEKQIALFALAALGGFIFWYLDASWKEAEQNMIDLCSELELALVNPSHGYQGPSIGRTFKRKFHTRITKRRFFRTMSYDNVWLPHSIIVVLGVALSIGVRFNA